MFLGTGDAVRRRRPGLRRRRGRRYWQRHGPFLRRDGSSVYLVGAGTRAMREDLYPRKRDELWFEVAERARRGHLALVRLEVLEAGPESECPQGRYRVVARSEDGDRVRSGRPATVARARAVLRWDEGERLPRSPGDRGGATGGEDRHDAPHQRLRFRAAHPVQKGCGSMRRSM